VSIKGEEAIERHTGPTAGTVLRPEELTHSPTVRTIDRLAVCQRQIIMANDGDPPGNVSARAIWSRLKAFPHYPSCDLHPGYRPAPSSREVPNGVPDVSTTVYPDRDRAAAARHAAR
jgi:hypothetical protein